MRKYSTESIVGIFVVIGLLCVAYMTVKLGKVSWFGEDSYPLYARFASVSGLRVGSPVEINGIQVGRVEHMSIDTGRQMALVELRVEKGVKVYDDASASIKTSGLIGDKFIKIDPGGGGDILKPGSTVSETTSAIDIEGIVSKYIFGDVNKKENK
jgi:phospholipid/cholesterol/gamma-HCH transport system substrate-binding protein